MHKQVLSAENALIILGFIIELATTEVAKDVNEICLVKRKRKYGLMEQSNPIHVVYILDWTKLYLYSGFFFFLPKRLSDYLLELFKNRIYEKCLGKITGNPLFNKYFCHRLCQVILYF